MNFYDYIHAIVHRPAHWLVWCAVALFGQRAFDLAMKLPEFILTPEEIESIYIDHTR